MDSQRCLLLNLFCFCLFGLYSLFSIRSYQKCHIVKQPPPIVQRPKKNKTLEHVKPNLYIYMIGAGRLGNLLTQYAVAEGLGYTYNRITYYSKHFSILKQLYSKIDINIMKLPEESDDIIHPSTNKIMVKIQPNKNAILNGYFLNYFYFNNITNLLMTKFSNFKPHINFKVQTFITDVKNLYYFKTDLPPKKRAESVCIHVRRGDFASAASKRMGRTVADKKSIQFAMDYFRKKMKNCFFIFISNGKGWCKTQFQNKDIFYSPFSSPLDDFVLASSCDHSIMTVGTFGWWSSWLTAQRGGIVLYFKNYCQPGSALSKGFKRNVWFPGNWLAYNSSSVELSKNIS